MAVLFEWKDSEFGLNVKAMDEEHKQLVDLMNKLYQSYTDKAAFETQLRHLEDLAKFTLTHFAHEEDYMMKIKYDGLSTHKLIHTRLLDQFKNHMEDFKNKKTLSNEFFNFLKLWLTSHIRGIDMKYSQFVNKAS